MVRKELTELERTITEGAGSYQSFLQRWGYDAEQQRAIQKSIDRT